MPVIIAAAGAAFSAIGGAITVGLGAVAGAVGGALGAIGLGALGDAAVGGILSLGGLYGVGAALSAWSTVALLASSGLSTPKIGANGNPQDFVADPRAGVPCVVDRYATPGVMVYETSSADSKYTWLHYFGIVSAGPIEGYDGFTADSAGVTFSGTTGLATSSPFTGKMGFAYTLGTATDAVLPLPSGTGPITDWGPTDTLQGLAAYRYCLKNDATLYASGPPKPRPVVKGPAVYDPRADSTRGGSGSQRADNPATWSFTGRDNPYLQALTFVLGRLLAGKPFLGLAAPTWLIDFAAFTYGANVADANGWKCAGVYSSQDDRLEVLKAMLQAGGGAPLINASTISCFVQAPVVSIATVPASDIAGPVSRPGNAARGVRINTVVPSYPSEDHDWQVVPADAYAVSAYVTADGERYQPVTYPMVPGATQARQLAAYGIYDAHEATPITLTLGPRWFKLKPGNTFTPDATLAGLLRTGSDLRVVTRTYDPGAMTVTLVCRTETAGKHTAALALTGGAPATPDATLPDFSAQAAAPAVGAWSLTGTSQTSTSGNSFPLLVVTGACDNAAASSVIFELSLDGSTPVSQLGKFAPTVTRKEFSDGIKDGQSYYVLVSYEVRGRQGVTRALGPVTAGVLLINGGSGGGGSGGGGGDGSAPADGNTLYTTDSPGSWSYTFPTDGFADVELWGGGGTPQADIYTGGDPKKGNPGSIDTYAKGAGGGGYCKKHIAVTAGQTVSGSVGGGAFFGMDGGDTTCSSPSMTAHGGTSGSITSGSATAGAGGAASGGDTNTSGRNGALGNLYDGGGAGNGGGDQTLPAGAGTAPGGGGAAAGGTGSTVGYGQNGRVKITFRTS